MDSQSRENLLAQLQKRRVSAIIRTDSQQVASDAMKAAIAGGFTVCEFTLTTPGALDLIAQFSADPKLSVGAGTVLKPEQVAQATRAGAQFIVSPVFDVKVIAQTRSFGAISVPGTFTATEMYQAHLAGADILKLFPPPANLADYVKIMLGPFPFLRIFPTSGVTIENFLDLLRAGAFGAGFVRPLFDPDDLAQKKYSAIEKRAVTIISRLENSEFAPHR